MGWAAEGPGPAWGSLGLAAVILSSCFLLTQARSIDVTVDPPEPSEGQDVTMTPGGTIDIFSVNWFRGTDTPHNRIFVYLPATGQENGPRFTGREKGRTDGSLTIRGLMLNDTGRYTVLKTTTTGRTEMGILDLEVFGSGPRPRPSPGPSPGPGPGPRPGSGSDPVSVTPSKAGKRAVLGITAWSLAGAVLVGILL